MRIQNYLYTQLPAWARPTDPILRHMLHRDARRHTRFGRWATRILPVATLLALLVISYTAYQEDTPLLVTQTDASAMFIVLYFPLVVVQFFTMIRALDATSTLLTNEEQRGTWEAVKITSHGAELSIRSRWAAVFYQMRGLLGLLLVTRVIFVGQILADLTDYQGHHLDLYVSGITPEVPLEAAVLLLAAFMTATLIQPLVMVGLNAAVGLYLAAAVRNRHIAPLLRIIIVLLEIGLFGFALLMTNVADHLSSFMSVSRHWSDQLFMALAGDQSLHLMHLPTLFEAWTDADYGVYLGAAILGSVLLLGVITNVLLWGAARQAARPARD